MKSMSIALLVLLCSCCSVTTVSCVARVEDLPPEDVAMVAVAGAAGSANVASAEPDDYVGCYVVERIYDDFVQECRGGAVPPDCALLGPTTHGWGLDKRAGNYTEWYCKAEQ